MVVHRGALPEEERLPPVPASRAPQGNDGSRHGGGAHPSTHRLPGRAGPPLSSRAASPTRRSCCSSTAARVSSAWRSGCSTSWVCANEIPVAALAKQFEEVFLPGWSEAVRLPRQSEALYLLQRIHDESHRFAITYHRELRGKRMTVFSASTACPASASPDAPGWSRSSAACARWRPRPSTSCEAPAVAARPGR